MLFSTCPILYLFDIRERYYQMVRGWKIDVHCQLHTQFHIYKKSMLCAIQHIMKDVEYLGAKKKYMHTHTHTHTQGEKNI